MATIQPVKGTRDFYPAELAFHNWLLAKMAQASKLFGYEAYDGPILESFELYAAKSSDELVNQQSFVFEDRGGRKIVLRPELTPTLARMVAEKQQSLAKPIKWYSIGPMWRYEQPQKGRAREFWQWNCDCLGSNSPLADAEVIAVAITFMQSLGLTKDDFVIKLNDRKWFKKRVVDATGVDAMYLPTLLALADRLEKLSRNDLRTWALKRGLAADDFDKVYDVLTKSPNHALFSTDGSLGQVIQLLDQMNLGGYAEPDISTVRGLDYYTGMVFEIRDRAGKLRSIGGGGRYENLVKQVGGQPLTAVGFAIGDIPVEELLRAVYKYPSDITSHATALVTVFSQDTLSESISIAHKLRSSGIGTELYLTDPENITPLDKQLKYAQQKQIPHVVIIGPEEIARNQVTVKTLSSGDQRKVNPNELVRHLTHEPHGV